MSRDSFTALMLRWITISVTRIGWLPASVFALHLLLIFGFDAYTAFPSLDIPMHLLGGIVIGIFMWVSLGLDAATPIVGQLPVAGRALFAWSGVFTAAVLWEGAEWLAAAAMRSPWQGSLDDTMLDMVLGAVGGLAAVLVQARRRS